MSPKPYDLTTYDGNRVDWITRTALEETAARLGYDLTVTQGSYNAGAVSASAGTHDGGGVVDLAPFDRVHKVRELRRTGFAAWYRPPIPGLWPPHIHAVLIGNAKLAPSAARQVTAYLNGRDGLKGNGPDNGPRDFTRNRFVWRPPSSTPNITAALAADNQGELVAALKLVEAHGTKAAAATATRALAHIRTRAKANHALADELDALRAHERN